MEPLFVRSCKNLDITINSDNDISETTLITQYRKMSLLYHPDKNNSINAVNEFQEIHDSYEYLGKYLGYVDEDYYIDEYDSDIWTFDFYKENIMSFLDLTLGDEIIKLIQEKLVNNDLIDSCIKKIDHSKLIRIHKFLISNKDKFNISNSFLNSIETLLNIKNKISPAI
jgi:hypothetical protein